MAGLMVLAGCSDSDEGDESGAGEESSGTTDTTADGGSGGVSSPEDGPSDANINLVGNLVVFAPEMLSGPLDGVAEAFEQRYAEVTVEMVYGDMPTLLAQLGEGTEADVLVTPDEGAMATARTEGLVDETVIGVGGNPLALVTPPGNPAEVEGLADLADADLNVAACAEELACWKLAERALEEIDLELTPDVVESEGSPAVVAKAEAGEIDAGVVFAIDALAAGDGVEIVALGDGLETAGRITAGAVLGTPLHEIAEAYISFFRTSEGVEIMEAAGLLGP